MRAIKNTLDIFKESSESLHWFNYVNPIFISFMMILLCVSLLVHLVWDLMGLRKLYFRVKADLYIINNGDAEWCRNMYKKTKSDIEFVKLHVKEPTPKTLRKLEWRLNKVLKRRRKLIFDATVSKRTVVWDGFAKL